MGAEEVGVEVALGELGALQLDGDEELVGVPAGARHRRRGGSDAFGDSERCPEPGRNSWARGCGGVGPTPERDGCFLYRGYTARDTASGAGSLRGPQVSG